MINFKAHPALLFTPANKEDLFQKAEAAAPNGIIFDLEDAVAAQDKDKARETLWRYLSQKRSSKILKLIRINNLSTTAGLADLLALHKHSLFFDALVYPKTESAEEVNLISTILKESYPKLAILGFIETALGLSRITTIVKESPNLAGLLFGGADYAADVGCKLEASSFLVPRTQIVQGAALRQLACYDTPYFDFKNVQGLIADSNQVKILGFTGKLAIHPSQISGITSAFKPSEAEYQQAQSMIKIYEAAKGHASQFEGKMIDVPVYKKSLQIVEIYKNLS